jgi:hypothetical protein
MKKAILVPSELGQQVRPVDESLSNIDSEMMRIMQMKNLPMDIKIRNYNQLLQRYMTIKNIRNQPMKLDVYEKDTFGMPENEIIDGIPVTKKEIGRLLLNFIRKQDNIVIEPNGEVSINGNRIPESNIVDLVHDIVRDRKTFKPPAGSSSFLKALKSANVPLEYIGNKKRLTDLLQTAILGSPHPMSPAPPIGWEEDNL